MENCKSRNSKLTSPSSDIKKLIKMQFRDFAIGTDEKIEILQQQIHKTLDAILPLSKRKTKSKKLDNE